MNFQIIATTARQLFYRPITLLFVFSVLGITAAVLLIGINSGYLGKSEVFIIISVGLLSEIIVVLFIWLSDALLRKIDHNFSMLERVNSMQERTEARISKLDSKQDTALAVTESIIHRNLLLNRNRFKIAIKICSPKKETAKNWGDTHYAEYFSKALRNEGFLTSINVLPEWDDTIDQDADIVLHLRGLKPYLPKPGALNILWIISHPDDVTIGECEDYDMVLVASSIFAKELSEKVDVPVHAFLQATDEEIFQPTEPDPSLKAELLFVGNSINRNRESIAWASQMNVDLNIYGMGWDTYIPERYIKADYYPNDKLGKLYSSADIALNQHWSDMTNYGFISNRIFDALASGAFVISDDIKGIDELFERNVPTFSDKQEFQKRIKEYLANPKRRRVLANKGRKIVLEKHTFNMRAKVLGEMVEDYMIRNTKNEE